MNKINKIKLLVYLVVSLISVLSMFAVSVLAADHIIINKVYVDPIATEAGGEAIELYNPTAQDADISGYKIMTESSGSDITIPQLTVIKAQHYYLIADLGWNVLKDNASWPNADHEEAMTMYNTDSGIALATAGGQIIDAVGWGNPLMMDAYLFETTPTSNPAPGTVIKRINFQDTDINLNDFISAQPLFFNSTLFEPNAPEPDPVPDNETDDEDGTDSEEIGLPILVNVTNSLPSIVSFNFTIDDSEDEGYQVMPLPGAAKHVPLSVLIEDNDGSSDISKVSAVVTAQDYVKEYVLEKLQNLSDGALYSGNISLDYFSAPTQYIVTLSAYDNANEKSETSEDFEYLSLVAFDIDTEELVLGNVKNKQETLVNGDNDFMTLSNPTVRNIGNTNLSLGMYSSNLGLGENKLQYGFGNAYYNVSASIADAVKADNALMFGANMTLPLNFKLKLVKYLKPDQYLANLNLVGAAS